MPLGEKKCYCDGPVIVESVGVDKKALSHCYLRRKFIYNLRRNA